MLDTLFNLGYISEIFSQNSGLSKIASLWSFTLPRKVLQDTDLYTRVDISTYAAT